MDFIIENWKFIVYLAIGLIEIILLLVFKRRPQIIDNGFMAKLSEFILDAELKYVQGSDKLKYVLEQAKIYLADKYVEADVKKLVEYMLTLPQKKGVNLNEK